MNHVQDSETLNISAPFPKPLQLHHLGDWQTFESLIIHSCAPRLVRNRAGQVHPDLAKAWTVSSNQLEITFQLRKDAFFANKTPVEAKHAAFAIVRHIALGGQYADSMRATLVGAEKIKSTHDAIAGVEIADQHTLKLHLKKPTPGIFADLGMLSFSIFQERDVYEKKDEVDPKFAAAGPYQLASYTDTEVVLVKNSVHWDRNLLDVIPEKIKLLPNTKQTDMERLLAGDLDIARSNASATTNTQLQKARIQKIQTGIMQYYLNPDFKGPALSAHPEITRLLDLLLDRQKIVKIMESQGLQNLEPITTFTGNIEILVKKETERLRSLEKEKTHALKRLAEIVANLRERRIFLKFATRDQNPVVAAISKSIIEELTRLGVPFQTEPVTPAFTYRNQRFGEFDLYVSGEGFDTDKPLRAARFIIGTDAKHTNIDKNHISFEIANRNPTSYEDHLMAFQDFNRVNHREGLAIPIVTDNTLLLFSNRIDTSRVTKNDYIWHPADLSFKREGNDLKRR